MTDKVRRTTEKEPMSLMRLLGEIVAGAILLVIAYVLIQIGLSVK